MKIGSKPLVAIGEILWFAGMYLSAAIVLNQVDALIMSITIWAAIAAGVVGYCVSMTILAAENNHLSGILFALIVAAGLCGVGANTAKLLDPISAAVAVGLAGTGLLAIFTIRQRGKDWRTRGVVVPAIGAVLAICAFGISVVVTGGVSVPMGTAWSLCLLGVCCIAIGTEPQNPYQNLYGVSDGKTGRQQD